MLGGVSQSPLIKHGNIHSVFTRMWRWDDSGAWGGRITDLRSLLPPVCLLTAALPLALVPRNCNPASPELLLLLLLLLRASGGSPVPCRVHTSGCTSVPLDPAALLPALCCHVKRRQGSQVRQMRLDAFCLIAFFLFSPCCVIPTFARRPQNTKPSSTSSSSP